VKICVVVPSEEFLKLAGVRIRYQRIDEYLKNQGHHLSIEVIDNFRSIAHFKHNVYLFSKCNDSRSFLLARLLKQENKLVGVDFFDDYFSQITDSRFICLREWVRTMAGLLDFFLCSTERMKRVITTYMPEASGYIMNDPFEHFNAEKIATTIDTNLQRMLSTGKINVAWFGTGDNPYFPVGLHDLHAFSSELRALSSSGFKVNLSILTNRRALTVEGLEMLARIPVPYTLDEWSIDKEAALLERSLVAFIPVNAQNFSIAKSLNRAVSALMSGTQVLSTGYPLYAPFNQFIYHSSETLLNDIAKQKLVVSRDNLDALRQCLTDYADPGREAEKYAIFLNQLLEQQKNKKQSDVLLGLIHGVESVAACHKFAQRFRQLSISSPFSNPKLNYDVRYVLTNDKKSLIVELEDKVKVNLGSNFYDLLECGISMTGRKVSVLNLSNLYPELSAEIINAFHGYLTSMKLVNYQLAMKSIKAISVLLFPRIELYFSEKEAPYWVDNTDY